MPLHVRWAGEKTFKKGCGNFTTKEMADSSLKDS